MKKIGRIKYTTMGQYDPEVTYTEMNTVLYEGSRWEAKKETTGNAPPDNPKNDDGTLAENEFWRLFLPGALGDDYVKKTDLSKAPTETEPGKPGISYPDGKTIFADENGMLTGATSGKELTQEEMDEQLASGDLEPGSVVFLTGEAEGTNGLAIIVDKELNENSVHAIRNSAVAKAINAANALIAENQRLIAETQALRATLDSFGLSKICPVDVTDVTEANGMVLGAWEKNASVEGSLANGINKISKNLGIIKNLGVTGGASVTNAMSAISSYLTLEAGTYICIGKIQKECDMGLMYENGSLAYLMTGSRFFTTCVSFSSQTKIAFSAQSSSGFTLRDDMNLNLLQLIKMK